MKINFSKRIRRKICLYISESLSILSILSILSAIGLCEINSIGVCEMLIRAFLSLLCAVVFICLSANISAYIDKIDKFKSSNYTNNKVIIFKLDTKHKPIRKFII